MLDATWSLQMKITKTSKGYEVESSSGSGSYKVDPDKPWCDCPAFRFRESRKGGVCKHITAVRDFQKENDAPMSAAQERIDKTITDFVAERGEVEAIDLIEEFGEGAVERLLAGGELIEKRGKIRLLD